MLSAITGHNGFHHRVEIATEGEHVAQHVVVLRVRAELVGIDEELGAVVVEREYGRHACQVFYAEVSERDAELGDIQFLVVERLVLQYLHRHIHLFARGALYVMTSVSAIAMTAARAISVMMMLCAGREAHKRRK